jgi:hypothetical protein
MKQHILLQIPVPFEEPDFHLRDWFAAPALLAATYDWSPEKIAGYAYEMADALMEARKK